MTAHDVDEGRGTLPSRRLHAANFSLSWSSRTEPVALSLSGSKSGFSLAWGRECLKKRICQCRDYLKKIWLSMLINLIGKILIIIWFTKVL